MSRKPPPAPPPFTVHGSPAPPPRPARAEFEVGSTCYLQSGSPKMTVTHVYDDGTVDVAWCNYGTAEMYHAKLPIASLRKDWK